MFAYLWGKLAYGHKQGKMRSHPRAAPHLEVLEDRCLLTSSISEFALATAGSFPIGITAGSHGDIWFTQAKSNQIGEIDPVTHFIAAYTIPTPTAVPASISVGPDGNLWFAESVGNKIGTINPLTHAISEYAIPTAKSGPFGITGGPDLNLWFTEVYANQIGMINPTTHAVTEFAIPTANSQPAQIIAGPDGNLWFTENNTNKIGQINRTTHQITEFATPTADSEPFGILVGGDGNLWFTENNGLRIGTIDRKTLLITEYKTPTPTSQPFGITGGWDGDLWFTEDGNNRIGELNLTTHVVTETALPTPNSSPGLITFGPRGALWFTEYGANQIGEIQITPLITSFSMPQSVDAGQTVKFTATAIATPTPTVQWQVSTDGGLTFTPLSNGGIYSGVTTDTLTITNVTVAQDNNQYRAVFSNGIAYTNAATVPATLSVYPDLSITPGLPQGMVGAVYINSLTVFGGIMPTITVSNFTDGGTGLKPRSLMILRGQFMPTVVPPMITIYDTPTAAGIATFIVHVTDSAGFSLTQTFSIIIKSPPTISNLTQTQWTAGKSGFNGIMTIGGGTGPFHIATSSGLPTGLKATLSGQRLSFSGTPSVAKTFASGSITITDASGANATKTFSITINPPLQITTTTLPVWSIGTQYTATVQTTGGTGAVSFALASGKLPTGLSLSSNGHITGIPKATGSFTFTIIALDASGATFSKKYTV